MHRDEDNRLMVLSDNGKTSRYTYNAAGERIMKSYGTMEGVYINGAPQGITLTDVDFRLHQDKMSKLFCAWFALKFHETDNFTLYPASIISINKNRFTKHYFIGDKRVASRIGTGLFNNVYERNGSYVTAGQQDYAERMNQIQKQKEAYYKQQGIAPGVPTEKGAYGDPENTGVGYNAVLTELGNHDVPQGWIQTPRPNTTPNTNPGPPVSWNDPSNPDDPQAGYGYISNDTTKEETFFYHSDHLGSTSYITDDKANITQYDAYLPYGELLVDEHSSSEELPYKFNGKQFDEETGLYYYGARYLNPVASIWYGVDPMSLTKPTLLSYVYCSDNPIRYYDKDGKIGIDGVIIGGLAGGLSQYLTIIMDKMDKVSINSFINANKELEGRDYLSITWGIATGAAEGTINNGISSILKIIKNPVAKFIAKEGIGFLLEGLENVVGRVINKEEMSVKSIIAETLISKGVGHILPSSYLKKATAEARHNYSVALHKLEKLQSRRTPNMKLIRNAKSAMREARALYETLVSFTTGVETVKKEVGKKVQSQLPKDYGGQ